MDRIVQIWFYIFSALSLSAQVGIGTTSPQKDLHVSGTTSTIRIESLSAANNVSNDGVNFSPVYVDALGNLSLHNGSGSLGNPPFNFLIEDPNFIPDNPYGVPYDTGVVVNNDDLGETYDEGVISSETFTLTQSALIEVKFGVTIVIEGSDLSAGPPYTDITYSEAIKVGLFFCVDKDSNGLSPAEYAEKYAYHGQYYMTIYGGIQGYTYLNSDGYLMLPAGTHTIYFYGLVEDQATNYTSVGFGGYKDYLKIRIYN